jgi:hypothetical protein
VDDIALALTFENAIAAQEARTRDDAPWLADAHLERADELSARLTCRRRS